MMPTIVYGLSDPRDGVIRYVGLTGQPVARMYRHLSQARRRDYRTNPPLGDWLLELLQLGINPSVVTLEEVKRSGSTAERRWIKKLSKKTPLFNRASGSRVYLTGYGHRQSPVHRLDVLAHAARRNERWAP